MKRDEAYKLMDSKCDKDYKNKHRFTSRGISLTGYNCGLEEIKE